MARWSFGRSIDQLTKFAAVRTIPTNSARTQKNRITSLRIERIVAPPSRAPQPDPPMAGAHCGQMVTMNG